MSKKPETTLLTEGKIALCYNYDIDNDTELHQRSMLNDDI